MFKNLVILCLIMFSVSGCGGDRENDPVVATTENLSLALEQAIDYSVIPAVDAFLANANTFDTTANNFCSAPDAALLDDLQNQWWELFEQWYRLSHYNFGPLNDDLVFPPYTFIDSLRLRGTDYTETVRDEIAADIAGTHALDEAYFSAKTFQRVGLLALESASFETASSEHSQVATDIIAEYGFSPRKCDVLTGLAGQIVRRADYVQAGWVTSFKNSGEPYRTLFLNGQLEDGSEPLTQLIASVQAFLDYLQARNVVTTAAPISDHSWQAIAESIDEVETLLEGTGQTTVSFFSLMESAGNQTAAATVRATITAVRQSITDRDAAMLDIRLGQLDGHFKREIPDSLDVELGIDFSDGD